MSERNNLDRMATPPENQAPTMMPPLQPQHEPQSLHFSVPTEFVELPSKGKYYPEGHPLKNKTSIEIKFMTAKEIKKKISFISLTTVCKTLFSWILLFIEIFC